MIHSLRRFSNLWNPSYPFARHVRSNPRGARRKIGSGTCPDKFARAFSRVCGRKGREKKERREEKGTDFRRDAPPSASPSRRVSPYERTRSTNFPDALRRSIDVDFEWAGTRNFARTRLASEGGSHRERARLNS